MDEIQENLRYIMQTDSKYVLATSGSGHSAMEASVASLVEPGDKMLVGVNGIWGARVVDMARRFGAEVEPLEAALGQAFSLEQIEAGIKEHKPKIVFFAQGESSTGIKQELEGVGELCRKHGALLLVDTVCSLGGTPFFVGERAMEKMHSRASPIGTYNLDLTLVGDYWGWYDKRFYHHTGLVSNMYALREALDMACEE